MFSRREIKRRAYGHVRPVCITSFSSFVWGVVSFVCVVIVLILIVLK